ncbi:MAG: GNAT family N-acetyltransferase [Actinomycetota bacterium]
METPQHLDPGFSEAERAERRAGLRERFADLPFELHDVHLDNYMDAEFRLSDAVDRLDVIGDIEIGPVTPDDVEDVLAFFDHDAFAGKPEWAMCYCRFNHVDVEKEWGERTWQQNRAELADALRSGAMRAVIARVDGRIVAWLNCSDRASSPEYATGDDDGVAQTFCWSVAPPYRGHGLARSLLETAIEILSADGIRTVEGHAVVDPDDASTAYVGTKALYESCGFAIVDESDGRAKVTRHL